MAYYDGYLNFNTKIDDSGMISGLKRLQSLAKKSAVAIGSGIAAGLVASTKAGMDFEAQMSKVQAISGASAGEIQALTEKAKQMGVETKFSATEAGEALEYMAMAGWKTEDMLSGIPGIMNLAAASGEDLGQVSDIVTDALTAFGLQAQDSSHFADVLATASSNANTNVSLMGATFKYVAPVAGAMKFSIEDTAQAIGLMANAGIKGEQAGTALRAMFTRLAKPPKDAAEAMSALNLVITNSDGSFKSLSDILTEMRSKFSKLTDEQKTQYAAALAGQEAMSGLLAIVNASGNDFDKLAGAIANADGASKKMADTMNDNLKGQIVLLGSSMESLGLAIYDGISEPMKEAVKSGIVSVNELTESINGGELRGAVSNIGELFGGLIENTSNLATSALPSLIQSLSWVGENMNTVLSVSAALLVAFKGYAIITSVVSTITSLTNAFKSATTVLNAYTAACAANANVTQLLPKTMSIMQLMVGLLTKKIEAATVATELWSRAMTFLSSPSGIALVITAVSALVAGIATLIITTDNANKALKKINETYAQNIESIDDASRAQMAQAEKARTLKIHIFNLDNQIKSGTLSEEESTKAKKRLQNAVEQLNEIIPDLNLNINSETGEWNIQRQEVELLTQSFYKLTKAKAMAAAYESKINAAAQKIVDLDAEIEKTPQKVAGSPMSAYAVKSMQGYAKEAGVNFNYDPYVENKAYNKLIKEKENAEKELENFSDKLQEEYEKINSINNGGSSGGGSSGGGSSGGTSYGGSSSQSSSSGGSSSAEKESKSRAEAYKKGVEQEIEAEERKFSILKRRGQVSKKDYAANIAYRADCYRGYADAVLKQDGITAQEQAEIRREWIEKAEELETEYLLEYINMDKEALDKQRKNGEITQREYWNKLTALRDKYFAEGSDEWITYSDEIIELQKQSITEVYTEIAQQAKDSLSDIESAQSSLESKLKGFGNIFKQNVIRKAGDHGEDLSFVTLRNFEEENKALLAYEDALEQFRERGAEILGDDFSAFFAQFSEMSVEEGTEAVRALLSASDEEFEESLNGWKEYQRNSERFAENYYKSQKEKMLSELRESFDNVSDEFFDSGEYAAEAFGEGFFSQIEEIFRDISDAISMQMTNLTPQLSIAASPVSGGTTYNNTTYNLLSSGESVRQQIQAIDAAETVKKMRGM